MALKPGTTPAPTPRFNPTMIAILGALLFAVVFGTVVAGSPLRAIRLAYTDYSREPVPASSAAPNTSTVPPDAKSEPVPKQ